MADVNVACRQLGLGAGTIVPLFLGIPDIEEQLSAQEITPVFPEVAITASGCTGTEDRLVDCEPQLDTELDYQLGRDCLGSGTGLVIACVDTPGDGAHHSNSFESHPASIILQRSIESKAVLEVMMRGLSSVLLKHAHSRLHRAPATQRSGQPLC